MCSSDLIRKDVEKKAKWEEWPTFEEIWAALSAQMYSDEVNSFKPYWVGEEPSWYRDCETDLALPHIGRCFLGAGRVSVDPGFDASSTSYRTVIYFVLNEGTNHCKLFEVKPGCCKRFKKR